MCGSVTSIDNRPVGHSRESETKPTHTGKWINGRGSPEDRWGRKGRFFSINGSGTGIIPMEK